MYSLKVFVGVDGRWVLCEKFPDDEIHVGLHDYLDVLVKENIELEESIGFYNMNFIFIYGYGQNENYLDINSLTPIV